MAVFAKILPLLFLSGLGDLRAPDLVPPGRRNDTVGPLTRPFKNDFWQNVYREMASLATFGFVGLGDLMAPDSAPPSLRRDSDGPLPRLSRPSNAPIRTLEAHQLSQFVECG